MDINVFQTIGKSSAILHTDGLALFDRLETADGPIIISFKGIMHCTTAFLNASIGKFVMLSPEARTKLKFIDTTSEIKHKIDVVIENAIDEKKRASLRASAKAAIA